MQIKLEIFETTYVFYVQRALPSFLLFQLLMDLRNHESAQRGVMFFSFFRALKLLLK